MRWPILAEQGAFALRASIVREETPQGHMSELGACVFAEQHIFAQRQYGYG